MAHTVRVPELGEGESAEVIEICVAEGDMVEQNAALIVLESEKTSMEIPSPLAGKVLKLQLAEGDQVQSGVPILDLESAAGEEKAQPPADNKAKKSKVAAAAKVAPAQSAPAKSSKPSAASVPAPAPKAPQTPAPSQAPLSGSISPADADTVHAGPAVRRMARELGVDLQHVAGSGPRGRIVKEDVEKFVQQILSDGAASGGDASSSAAIPAVPLPDYARHGELHEQKMGGVQRTVARNMRRSWLNVPHVTQFDDADISELEDFRATLNKAGEEPRLTLLPFAMKAVAATLAHHPRFNSSLREQDNTLLLRDYIHIGMAVDTEAGLMVPVLRNVDKKGVRELAAEIQLLAARARERSLSSEEMEGGCFTISSLGALGGTGFTPIINAPEAAILGISRLSVKPVYQDGAFHPRKMLPLSLSYDHRIIDGATAGRFFQELCATINDPRRILL